MKSLRIQLNRKAGFNLQEHSRQLNGLPAVNCARPGEWGNPFTIKQARTLHPNESDDQLRKRVVLAHAELCTDPEFQKCIRNRLTGHNLACWCKPNQDCHCDNYLAIINKAA